MADNGILGKDCQASYCDTLLDGSNTSTATWNAVDNIRDLTLNLDKGEADMKTRGSGGWDQTKTTFKSATVEFEMLWKPSDQAFAAIRDAYLADTEIAFAAMDGDINASGSQGLASNFEVSTFSRSEPLEEGVKVSVTLKPSSHTEWYEVV
jgi:predicted secreted protein